MKLKTLSLVNYRGFEQLEIDFQDDVNVIAGVNGVGKSSILDAIRILYSRGLPRFTPANIRPLAFVEEDIQQSKISALVSCTFEHKLQAYQIEAQRIDSGRLEELSLDLKIVRAKIEGSREPDSAHLLPELQREEKSLRKLFKSETERWSFLNALPSSTAKMNPTDEKLENRRIKKQASSDQLNPVVMYFSVDRQLVRPAPSYQSQKPLSVSGAYLNALDARPVRLPSFASWFRAQEALGGPRRQTILQKIHHAAYEFLGMHFMIKSTEYKPGWVFFLDKEGTLLTVSQLSDGERNILALVFDIARRLSLANPDLDDPIADGKAIVLIDELELHLHPSWQRQVLRRLKNTFKNCQFIVTTHSPQVIGEVEARSLILLGHHDGKVIKEKASQTLGMDSNWILLHLMGTEERDEETKEELRKIQQAVTEKDLGSARELINQLELKRGIFAALQASKSLLDRFELLERKNAKKDRKSVV